MLQTLMATARSSYPPTIMHKRSQKLTRRNLRESGMPLLPSLSSTLHSAVRCQNTRHPSRC